MYILNYYYDCRMELDATKYIWSVQKFAITTGKSIYIWAILNMVKAKYSSPQNGNTNSIRFIPVLKYSVLLVMWRPSVNVASASHGPTSLSRALSLFYVSSGNFPAKELKILAPYSKIKQRLV